MLFEKRRRMIRAERVDTAPGCIGHMTIDEIRTRTLSADVSFACPACGRTHMTVEEKEEAELQRVIDSLRYRQIVAEAGSSTGANER